MPQNVANVWNEQRRIYNVDMTPFYRLDTSKVKINHVHNTQTMNDMIDVLSKQTEIYFDVEHVPAAQTLALIQIVVANAVYLVYALAPELSQAKVLDQTGGGRVPQ